jgi:hypothetical protein
MDNLESEFVQIHQERIRREANIMQALWQSGLIKPHIIDRGFSLLGETLIRMGTRLKDHARTQITAEEAPVPTFLIML